MCDDNVCKYAVIVDNATKSYRTTSGRKFNVFSRTNLILPYGKIYGLLGPSGCGKTSLLRCILGRLELDEGSVLTFGHLPGTKESGIPGPNVGYMPQETCIPETFTIEECWTYFGTVLGLSIEKIYFKVNYFIELLNLPSKNTIISNLSGGQLRRVAFATAIFHEPKLLILDEPTVGIDPITKRRMWNHLLMLANEKHVSIILTTHYIEEARAAHVVGLMHGGTLVEEDYTPDLLLRYNCSSLEDVFLKICCDSTSLTSVEAEGNSSDVRIAIADGKLSEEREILRNFTSGHSEEKCASKRFINVRDFCVRPFVLKAVIRKNLIHLYRFPGAIMFISILPCFQVLMSMFSFGVAFNQLPVAVFNEDFGLMGSQYLSFISSDIIALNLFNTSASTSEAFRAGNVRGIIVITHNFSKAHSERIFGSSIVTNAALSDNIINVTLDNTYLPISTYISFHLLNSFESFLSSSYNASGLNILSAQPVINFEKKTIEFLSMPDSLVMCIGVMVMACYFAPAAVAILNFFVEKHRGHLERSIVSGVGSVEIVLGLMTILVVILSVQVALVMLIAGVTMLKGLTVEMFFLFYCVLCCVGLSGVGLGFVLSVTFSQIYLLLSFSGTMMVMSGALLGSFWPLQAAHYFLQYVMLALPLAYPVKAIVAIYFESKCLAAVLQSLSVSAIWTVAFLTLTMVLLRRKI